MIAKHVPMKSVEKSNFASLVRYLCDTQRKEERIDGVTVTNCGNATPDGAVREVLATQSRNTRARSDKTYHLIVSFRPGEQVSEVTCQAIEAYLCHGLGLGEHQRISALHHDTDSLHLHIAINKIHPRRYTIHNPYYDHPKLGHLCTELEREHGLQPDNHCARQRGAACRAADMERHGGLESLLGWIRRNCQEQIVAAPSWSHLHCVLHAHGLALHERGTGLVVMAANGTAVKASSIDPSCSKPKLECRFGEYEPPCVSLTGAPQTKTYAKEPLPCRIDTTRLYARYRTVQQQAGALAATARDAARACLNRQIQAARQRSRLKRAAIKLLTGPGLARRVLSRGASETLRDELHKIHATYRQQRKAITLRFQRRTWVDWLRAAAMDNDREALAALRARVAAPGVPGNSVTGRRRAPGPTSPAGCDSITKNGTVIYRFGPTAVRDDGGRLTVSRNTTVEGLQAALRMAAQRYGPYLRVGGTAAFREEIVHAAVGARLAVRFDDALLEFRRQTMMRHVATRSATSYQTPLPDRLAGKVPTATRAASGMRRGSGRHRTGP